jgi:acetoacetyl-CoA synthetase
MYESIWRPSPERVASANLTAFMQAVEHAWNTPIANYWMLERWALDHPEKFWQTLWAYAGVIAQSQGETVVVNAKEMPGAKWFPEARLNFAENLLRRGDDGTAIIFWNENKLRRSLSFAELRAKVSQLAQALHGVGVKSGDRVAAFMPNIPESVIAALASSSLGAIFSSCSPDFGVQGVVDRFGQIAPKVLLAADRYVYNGKEHDLSARIVEIAKQLTTLEKVVIAGYQNDQASAPHRTVTLDDFIAPYVPGPIEFAQLPFDHPLYILYSSGTTGAPKCIVHGAGGTLLQHLKEHLLHTDIKRGDPVFYFTTCGWMMWNWLISALASGATIMLYDGSPFFPDGNILFDYADAEGMTVFGTSAKYIDALKKSGLSPNQTHALKTLKTMLSTGSPLAAEGFDYVYSAAKHDIHLSSISGGTDIISCFALGNPLLPVWRGELQCRGLAMQVEVFNEAGQPVIQEKGELVCTAPYPSLPIGFGNDPDGKKYRAAYFEKYPNVWRHGDYVELTSHNGLVIYGRSDAVLNPGGVRIGTAEIYRQVEQLEEVVESLVIGQQWPPGDLTDVRVVLFVRLRDGAVLDQPLVEKIKLNIRKNTTPRHVPARIVQVADIPRTKSGKIVELAVRNVVHGLPVKNIDALANPEALEDFRNRVELQS